MPRGVYDGLPEEDALWKRICECEGETFRTVKGLEFTYAIRGYEMFVSRRDKSITRASVDIAYRAAREIQESGGKVDGPKKLKVFGASYLFPIFMAFGIIDAIDVQLRMDQI